MSNRTLDNAAEAIARLRAQPHLAALREPEEHIVAKALRIAPELDHATVGAAWIILGNLLGRLAGQHADAFDLPAVVNLTQLAGQRLYSGVDVPREVRCRHVYESGAQCKHTAAAAGGTVLDQMMAGHYATYHPGETWPPEETEEEAEERRLEGLDATVAAHPHLFRRPACATCGVSSEVRALTFELPHGAGLLCEQCAKPVIESTLALQQREARQRRAAGDHADHPER